jgi:AhpD family alkylhydroperoxidase
MAHVQPRERSDLGALEGVLAGVEATMGFVPNSMLTMAHMPQLPAAFSLLAGVVFGADLSAQLERLKAGVPEPGNVAENLSPALVQLIAFATSVAAGCRYCQAHTSHSAHRQGEEADKLDHVLEYETHPAFSAAERAAIGLALAAGQVPNAASAEQFRALEAHFSERQIVQIVAVIALFGFLNRWNDTMATSLEDQPSRFARESLDGLGWMAGKHGE